MSYDFENIKALIDTHEIGNINLAIALSEHFFIDFYNYFMSIQKTFFHWVVESEKRRIHSTRQEAFWDRKFNFFERKSVYKGFVFVIASLTYSEENRIGDSSNYDFCTCGAFKGRCKPLHSECPVLPF